MITSMKGCVVCNELWPWPISSRSFSHDLAIKLLKYGTYSRVCATACTVLNGFFPYMYLAQMITSMRGCITYSKLWPWPISSRSFSHGFAIKLLKYDTSGCVRAAANTVLDGYFPYLVQLIINMRRCHTQITFVFALVKFCCFVSGIIWGPFQTSNIRLHHIPTFKCFSSCLALSLAIPLKPGVKSRMKM